MVVVLIFSSLPSFLVNCYDAYKNFLENEDVMKIKSSTTTTTIKFHCHGWNQKNNIYDKIITKKHVMVVKR